MVRIDKLNGITFQGRIYIDTGIGFFANIGTADNTQ